MGVSSKFRDELRLRTLTFYVATISALLLFTSTCTTLYFLHDDIYLRTFTVSVLDSLMYNYNCMYNTGVAPFASAFAMRA